MKITIIIPTYNSQQYVQSFIDNVIGVIDNISNYDFQLLFVDDGSKDHTVELLKKNKSIYKNISILVLSKNFGQTNAILAGLKLSKSHAYIIMSIDMQESPTLIADFIHHWEKGYQLCIAYRKYRSDNFTRKIFSKIFYFIIRIDQPSIPKGGFDYGLMDENAAQALREKPINFRFLQGDLLDLGIKTKYIPCERVSNQPTSKKINFSRFKFNYFFDGIINMVRIPFKVLLLLSICSVLFASLNLMYHFFYQLFVLEGIIWSEISSNISFLILCLILLLVCFTIEFAYRIFDLLTQKKEFVIKEFIK